eukprot:UN08587
MLKTDHYFMWNNLGVCNCNDKQLWIDLNNARNKLNLYLQQQKRVNIIMLDIGSGKLLSTYYFFKTILDNINDEPREMHLIISDVCYTNKIQGTYIYDKESKQFIKKR